MTPLREQGKVLNLTKGKTSYAEAAKIYSKEEPPICKTVEKDQESTPVLLSCPSCSGHDRSACGVRGEAGKGVETAGGGLELKGRPGWWHRLVPGGAECLWTPA